MVTATALPHRDPPRSGAGARVALSAGALLSAAVLCACGGGSRGAASSAPGAVGGAEPASSPVSGVRPAGIVRRVAAPVEGMVVSASDGLLVASAQQPDGLLLLDARTLKLRAQLATVGRARHLSLGAPGSESVLVPDEAANRLLVLHLGSRRLSSTRVGAHPHDATPVAGRVFVSDEFGDALSVLRNGRRIARVGGFRQPGGVLAAADMVAAVDVGANTLTLLDPRTLAVAGRTAAGAGPTHAAAGPGERIYVVDTRGEAILVFAATPRLHRVARVLLRGRPYGIAIDQPRERLWVTLTGTNQVAELRLGSGGPQLVRKLPSVRQPNSVAVDPRDGAAIVGSAAVPLIQRIGPQLAG